MNEYLRLDEGDRELYARVLRREPVQPEDADRLSHLRDMHLVGYDPHNQKPVALDPRSAVKQLAFESYAGIKKQLTVMEERGADFHDLATFYTHFQGGDDHGIRLIRDPRLVNEAISKAVDRGTEGLYSAQPTPRTPATLKPAYQERDLDVMRRGVEFRVIYPESARAREFEARWMRRATEAGAEFRTSPIPFSRMIYIKGVAAYLPDSRTVKDDGIVIPGGIEVTHPALLAYLENQYGCLWDISRPWSDGKLRPSTAGDGLSDRERTILGLLGNGSARSSIARKLDISDRAVRTVVTGLRKRFGAETDFQLAIRWRESTEYEPALDPA